MNAQAEPREMVEEAQRVMEEQGLHPWMMLKQALKQGDRQSAEAVLEAGSSKLSPREKIAGQQAIKRRFPETPGEFKSVQERREEQAEQPSVVGEAIASRLASRRKQQDKIKAASKPSVGWNVPLKDGVDYATPNPADRNA